MILVDTNVIMYAAGAEHRNKKTSVRLLEHMVETGMNAAVDAETLQEILHRFRAINRWKHGKQVYELARDVFPNVVSITAEHVDTARDLLQVYPRAMARDALHAAVCIETRAQGICTFDRDFDRFEGVRRIRPAELIATG